MSAMPSRRKIHMARNAHSVAIGRISAITIVVRTWSRTTSTQTVAARMASRSVPVTVEMAP